jgi:hypothetical protein
MEPPKSGRLLRLMTLHAAEDVIERGDRCDNVQPFVEHYAFCSLAHCRVSDFRS